MIAVINYNVVQKPETTTDLFIYLFYILFQGNTKNVHRT